MSKTTKQIKVLEDQVTKALAIGKENERLTAQVKELKEANSLLQRQFAQLESACEEQVTDLFDQLRIKYSDVADLLVRAVR